MNKSFFFHGLSFFLAVLFCWIVFPVKWIKRFTFETRKANAIRRADLLASETGKKAFVVQQKMNFIVGLRSELRNKNSKIRSQLAKENKSFLNFDYRNAIIYTTK